MIWEIDEKKETIEGLDPAGRPDPAYAAALGLLQAPPGRRALAAAIDLAAWLLLQLPFWIGAVPLLLKLATGSISPYGFMNHPSFVLAAVMAGITVLLSLVYCVVQLALHGVKGLTIGKAIGGIRTVNVRTLERPGFGHVLLRSLILLGSSLVPLLLPVFLISPLFDQERRGRGWHDKATGVWLVDVRSGLNPFDEKRMRVARKMVKAEPVAERAVLPSLATPTDDRAQPEYRPGNRISAGVLGVARPYAAHERPEVGLPQSAAPAQPTAAEAGKPVLGGFRPAGSGPDVAGVPLPVDQGLVAEVPLSGAPAPRPAPQPSRTVPTVSAPQPVQPQAQHAQPTQAPAPQAQPQVQPQPPAQAQPTQAQAQQAQAQAPQAQPGQAPQASQAQASQPQGPQAHVQPAPQAQPTPAPAPQAQATPSPVPSAAPVARFGLRLDTGESILIAAPVLLGRNPDAAGHAGARPIPLTDASRSLSKTHMLLRPVSGGLEIVDCGSTNGSGLIREGVEYAVSAGVPVMTTAGDTIRLGDRRATVVRV